jgi:predicted nucleic acid-binding protein
VEPALDIVWIDGQLYQRSMAALIAAHSRKVSLTDWSSFEVMRSRGLKRAFTFDQHFESQGFMRIPH